MNMYSKIDRHTMLGNHTLGESAYPFDCTFFRLICLTAKVLRRMTMCDFLVGAKLPHPCSRPLPASMQVTEPEKRTLNMPFFVNDSRYKRLQLRIPGL